MSSGVTITADSMKGEQIALLVIAAQLREHPLFTARMLNEVASYKDMGGVTKHDAADRKEFFRYAAAFAVSHVKQTVLQNLMKPGLFKNYLSRLYTKTLLSEMEASSRFLLSHNNAASRVAEGIFPVTVDKGDDEIKKSESSVVYILDAALKAAREAALPSVTSVMESRRAAAMERVARLDAQALGS